MLLWFVLPRTGPMTPGFTDGLAGDLPLVRVLLLSQAAGMLTEVLVTLVFFVRCAVITVFRRDTIRAASALVGADATLPEASLLRCSRGVNALLGGASSVFFRAALLRSWTWINGAVCGCVWGFMTALLRGDAASASSWFIAISILTWSAFVGLAVLAMSACIVGSRTRLRAKKGEYALRDTGTFARLRPAPDVSSQETLDVLSSNTAFRALDEASWGTESSTSTSSSLSPVILINGPSSGPPAHAPAHTARGGARSAAFRRCEELTVGAALREADFFFSIALAAALVGGVGFVVIDGCLALCTQLGTATSLASAISLLDAVSNIPRHGYNPSTRVLCWWVGWNLTSMATLVILARGLQAAWDADDALSHAGIGGSESQSRALATASEAYAAGAGACVPLTLERVAENVYRRTREDAAGRRIGLQLLANPLHDLRDVRDAVASRTRDTRPRAPSPLPQSPNTRSLILAGGSSSARGSRRLAEDAHGSAAVGIDSFASVSSTSESTEFGSTPAQHAASHNAIDQTQRAHQQLRLAAFPSTSPSSTARVPALMSQSGAGIGLARSPRNWCGPHANCFVCFERVGDAVFMECGHAGVCMECAETIVNGRTKRTVMTRSALFALTSTGAQVSVMRAVTIAPQTDTPATALSLRDPAQSTTSASAHAASARPVNAAGQASAIIRSRGSVGWRGGATITSSALSTLEAALEHARNDGMTEAELQNNVDVAVAGAVRPAARRATAPALVLPMLPGSARDTFLVSILTGGSGVCPVCRAPVTSLLRVGPDVRTTDGRSVALVLPLSLFSAKGAPSPL